MGDPKFCWSDVEQELKVWAVVNAEAIETVIADNERKYAEALEAESQPRAALRNMTRQRFTVAAKSINTNAFGHRQYVLVADDGSAFKVQRSYTYSWNVGQIVTVPLAAGDPNWAAVQCECPERIENCPVQV